MLPLSRTEYNYSYFCIDESDNFKRAVYCNGIAFACLHDLVDGR